MVGVGLGDTAVVTLPAPSFDELYRERWDRLVRLAVGLCGVPAVAEELVQDAFAELSRRWDDVDDPAAYLRASVVNRCRNHRRWLGVRTARPLPVPPLLVDDPEVDEVWAVLRRLSPRRRAAVVLRYYEDLSIDEIAALLDCRPGTVSSLLHRALADLREVLDDGC